MPILKNEIVKLTRIMLVIPQLIVNPNILSAEDEGIAAELKLGVVEEAVKDLQELVFASFDE